MIEPLDVIILFVFGTIIGSFLNALAFRYNTGRSMWGRSACLSCGTTLKAIHLVPLLSYLGLKGKCASCKAGISPQYPIVEMVAGVLTAFSFMETQGDTASFIVVLSFFTILLFISVYDLRHTIIPDAFVYAAALIALGASFFGYTTIDISDSVLGALVLSVPIALLWVVSRGRLIGLGDAKLFFACGAFLGLVSGAAAFMLSFWIGALFGLGLLLVSSFSKRSHGVTMESEVPFGPFIVLATAVAYFGHIGLYDILAFLAL